MPGEGKVHFLWPKGFDTVFQWRKKYPKKSPSENSEIGSGRWMRAF